MTPTTHDSPAAVAPAAGDWTRQGEDEDDAVQSGGDVGGDYQVGESYSVRYRHPDHPGAVVTRYFYAEEHAPDHAGNRQYGVSIQDELIRCSDPEQPGDTELWSDARYDATGQIYETPLQAEHAAIAAAYDPAWERDVPIEWDGHAPWEDPAIAGTAYAEAMKPPTFRDEDSQPGPDAMHASPPDAAGDVPAAVPAEAGTVVGAEQSLLAAEAGLRAFAHDDAQFAADLQRQGVAGDGLQGLQTASDGFTAAADCYQRARYIVSGYHDLADRIGRDTGSKTFLQS